MAVISREVALARIAVVNDNGGIVRAAARELSMDHSALLRSLRTIKAAYGLEPEIRYVTKGRSEFCDANGEVISFWDKTKLAGRDEADAVQMPQPRNIVKQATLYDQQGKITQRWVTEKPEDTAREALWEAFANALSATLPRAPSPSIDALADIADGAKRYPDLCACYVVSDHHLGMYSWARETGADYDIPIAERLLTDAVDSLVESSPACETALIAVLGDLIHYDSNEAVTPAHKNLLDADGRAQKMVEAAVRSLRHIIARVRERHPVVHIIFEPGNHDPFSIMFLRVMFATFFENDPGVIIDDAPGNFHYFEFGTNLVGTHHGDKAKMERLPGIMAADRSEAWGRTQHRTFWTGHVHHDQIKEYPGCTVESFGILAAPDAYAAGHGYRSKRVMKSIILHRTHGEIQRHMVNPGMLPC